MNLAASDDRTRRFECKFAREDGLPNHPSSTGCTARTRVGRGLSAAIEGLVAQHMRAWCDYSQPKHSLHYWQTRSRREVDFVVYGETGLYAIEVKNAKRVNVGDLTALKHFAADYPQAKRYLLYRGDDRLNRDGVLCMSAEEFLPALKPGNFPE